MQDLELKSGPCTPSGLTNKSAQQLVENWNLYQDSEVRFLLSDLGNSSKTTHHLFTLFLTPRTLQLPLVMNSSAASTTAPHTSLNFFYFLS